MGVRAVRGNFTTDRCGKLNPNYKDGRKGTRLYSIYRGMITRCYNSNTPNYKRYGARGITMCDEWKDNFQTFYDWAMSHGYSDDLTIDRIDNNGNYEPSNCRWVDMKKQTRNNSRNHIVKLNGIERPLIEWTEIYKINYKTVRDRLKRGWNYEKALTEPVETKFRRKVGGMEDGCV